MLWPLAITNCGGFWPQIDKKSYSATDYKRSLVGTKGQPESEKEIIRERERENYREITCVQGHQEESWAPRPDFLWVPLY